MYLCRYQTLNLYLQKLFLFLREINCFNPHFWHSLRNQEFGDCLNLLSLYEHFHRISLTRHGRSCYAMNNNETPVMKVRTGSGGRADSLQFITQELGGDEESLATCDQRRRLSPLSDFDHNRDRL
jgi:hypothetical protein